MENISTTEQLVDSIRLFELKLIESELFFKDDIKVMQDYFKPINLVKHACNDLMSTPDLKQKVISTLLSLIAGYASKKLIFGDKKNIVKDIIGSVLQIGVTKMVSTNSERILLAISSLIKSFKMVSNSK